MVEMVGFRFHPTDEEVINHYIRHKNAGNDSLVENVINVIKICDHEPWELAALSNMNSENDRVYYFFSLLEPKFPNSQTNKRARNCGSGELTGKNRETLIMNRRTNQGSWKPTGTDRLIRENGRVIGSKKTLVFHLRNQNQLKRTNWVMHEYRAASLTERDYVVCKVKCKEGNNGCVSSSEVGQTSYSIASDSVNLISSSNIKSEVHNRMQETAESSIQFGGSDFEMIDWNDYAHPAGHDNDLVQPSSRTLTLEDLELISGLKHTNQGIAAELLAMPDGYSLQNSVLHTNHSDYRPPESITGDYVDSDTDSDSDSDSEIADERNFEETASSIESIGSSKGSNNISGSGLVDDEIQKIDCFAEHSEIFGQCYGDTETSESQNKVTKAAEPRTMKLKSLVIHLLILPISIVGFKKLQSASQLHSLYL